jgi:hypothetical protein
MNEIEHRLSEIEAELTDGYVAPETVPALCKALRHSTSVIEATAISPDMWEAEIAEILRKP